MLCRNSTYAIIAPTCVGKVISSRGCKNVCKIESGGAKFFVYLHMFFGGMLISKGKGGCQKCDIRNWFIYVFMVDD
jgi:hypothetical protein